MIRNIIMRLYGSRIGKYLCIKNLQSLFGNLALEDSYWFVYSMVKVNVSSKSS